MRYGRPIDAGLYPTHHSGVRSIPAIPVMEWSRVMSLPAAALLASTALEARAGPWAQDKGAFVDVTDVSYERSGDNLETTAWRPGYYAELGLARAWTVILKGTALYRDDTLSQSLDIGLRREIWRGRRAAIGVEIEALLGESLLGAVCGQGVGARLALGTGYRLGSRNGFAVVDATVHYRGDSCLRQKASLVIGLDPTPGWQVLAKAYYENGHDVFSLKLEGSLARRIANNVSIGLGYRTEVGGQFREQAALIFLQRQGRITPDQSEFRASRHDWEG